MTIPCFAGRNIVACAVLMSISILATKNARADVFGVTGQTAATYLPPCEATAINRSSFSVDVSSRIYTNAVATFFDNGYAGNSQGNYQIVLQNSSGNVVASSPLQSFTKAAGSTALLVSAGFLFAPDGLQNYTLVPGNYQLILNVTNTACVSGNPLPYATSSLTWMLISSAADRIFASGFNAMIFDPKFMAASEAPVA